MRQKRARVYLLIIITLAIFPFAKAYEFSLSEQFSMRLDELYSIGVRKIGGKTIEQIIQESYLINFTMKDNVRVQNDDGTYRESAQWVAQGPNVISESHWQMMDRRGRTQINVHETMPRVGIDDDNFSKSSTIEVLISIHRRQLSNPRLIRNPDAIPALVDRLNNSKGGGVTGVGGGGDYRIAFVMRITIATLLDRLNLIGTGDPKAIDVKSFHRVMDLIEELKVNFKEGLKSNEYIYLVGEKKLYTSSEILSDEHAVSWIVTADRFIDELLDRTKLLPNSK